MSTTSAKGASDSGMEAHSDGAVTTDDTLKMEPFSETQVPGSTMCLACSSDGRFLSVGHSRGFSVWCAESLACVSEWLQDTVEITAIQFVTLSETAHVLCTIDDMGVARVFGMYNESIHLLSVINALEDVNKRSICLAFDISEEGDYGAASLSCAGAIWLEVYRFPRDAWLRDMRNAQSQTEDTEVKFTTIAPLITINPKRSPTVKATDGLADTLQLRDFLIHFLAVDKNLSSVHHREPTAAALDAEDPSETNERSQCCTFHFLLPCAQFPDKSKTKPQPGQAVAVCVWWSGSRNLSQYFLLKASKNKPDAEPVPDVLWPHANEIVCSAVSSCTRYIAVGLGDGLVSVWDRKLDCPLSAVLASVADSAFLRMHFVNRQPVPDDDCQTPHPLELRLLILCKNGAMVTATTGRGTEPSAALLSERPEDSGAVPTGIIPVPFLEGVILVVQRNGEMLLQDVLNGIVLSCLAFPSTHLMATYCSPVLAFNTKDHKLFVKGDNIPCASANASGSGSPGESPGASPVASPTAHVSPSVIASASVGASTNASASVAAGARASVIASVGAGAHASASVGAGAHSSASVGAGAHASASVGAGAHASASVCASVGASVSLQEGEEGDDIEELLSGLFIFNFGDCDATKSYVRAIQRQVLDVLTPEESCDLYLQQRARTAVERSKAIQETWKELEEMTGILQLSKKANLVT